MPDNLDSGVVTRHLAHSGHDVLMREVEKAAAKSGAPFLASDKPLAEARIRWSQAFDALIRVSSLEDALSSARDTPGQDETFRRLKAERDALRRAIKTGKFGILRRTGNHRRGESLYRADGPPSPSETET